MTRITRIGADLFFSYISDDPRHQRSIEKFFEVVTLQ